MNYYIDVQFGVFLVLRGWLGYVIRTLISGKYKYARFYMELDREILTAILKKLSTRLPWFADIYKRKLPSTFQATNEVMFLSWSPDGKIHFSVVHLYRNSNECTGQKCVWI